MIRARFAVAATLVTTTIYAGGLAAQAPAPAPAAPTVQAPEMHPILAGRKFTPPVKGEATVEFMQPVTKPLAGKNLVVTTIKVRNAMQAPIARLMVAETWYDGGGAIVAGGRGAISGLLGPGEIGTITIETPYSAKMKSNNWNFTHANGTVKTARVKVLEAPKDEPAKK